MKIQCTLLALLISLNSCKNRIDKASTLTLTTKNQTNYSVSVKFYLVKGSVRPVPGLALPPLSQRDTTQSFDATVVPIGENFKYIPYGELDSIRIVFDNTKFLSFKQPTGINECNIPFNIFCASNHICMKVSDLEGHCTYTITEEMYKAAKPL